MAELWVCFHVLNPVTLKFESYITQNPGVHTPADGIFYFWELYSEDDLRFWMGNFDFR
jgi:hypothetical protein